MADPVPAANAALLAAQAKGGQAGVDAYHAAIASLQQQRQSAVQQAMQEAALRGAPQGAVGSLSSTITNPYDQGIASMTQGLGNFQADMASRDQRMTDYNAAVEAARSFIPLQTEQAVAPIRARSEADLAMQRLQGQERLDEINANTRLSLAKVQAAIAAAKKKAAADDAKLNQGELQAMLPQGARNILGGVQALPQQLGQNQAVVGNIINQEAGQLGAIGGGPDPGLAGLGTAALMLPTAAAHASNKATTSAIANAHIPVVPLQGSLDRFNQDAQRSMSTTEWLNQGWAGSGPPGAGAVQVPMTPPPAASAAKPAKPGDSLALAISLLRNKLGPAAAQQSRQNIPTLAGAATASLMLPTAAASQFQTHDPQTDRYVGLSPEQFGGLDQFTQNALREGMNEGAIGAYTTPGQFTSNVLGGPGADIAALPGMTPEQRMGAQFQAPQLSRDIVQAALAQSAKNLQEQGGYHFTGPELANAMPQQQQSVFDFLGAQTGQPTAASQFTAAQHDQPTLDKIASAADQKKIDAWAVRNFQRTLPTTLGDPADIYQMFHDPNTGTAAQQQFEAAVKKINQIVTDWKKQDPSGNNGKYAPDRRTVGMALEQSFAENSLPLDPTVAALALMKAGF